MRYRIEIRQTARKQLRRLPADVAGRIVAHVYALEENPRPRGARKLTSREEWRIRVGDWRVLYEIDDAQQVVTIAVVKSRQSAYG